MKSGVSYLRERILLIAVFCIAVSICSAQTIDDNLINITFTNKDGNIERIFIRKNYTEMVFAYPEYAVKPFHFHEYSMKKKLLEELYSDSSSLNRQDILYKDLYSAKYSIDIKHKNNLDYLGISIFSAENSYINLLHRRSAALGFNMQKGNLFFETSLIANRYETREVTTQFGVSGFMQYRFSPYWSMAIWGTMYSSNPYFTMAAFPFVETTSYGGWVRYHNNGYGLKLGARRYFDGFQKQWKTEPIVTPSVKLGRKVIMELPMGPLVQKSMLRLLKKKTYSGPNIMPDF